MNNSIKDVKKQPKPDMIGAPAKTSANLTGFGFKAAATGFVSLLSNLTGGERAREVTTKSIDSCSRDMDYLVGKGSLMKEDLRNIKAYKKYEKAFDHIKGKLEEFEQYIADMQAQSDEIRKQYQELKHEMTAEKDIKAISALKVEVETKRFFLRDQEANIADLKEELEQRKQVFIEMTWEDFLHLDSASDFYPYFETGELEVQEEATKAQQVEVEAPKASDEAKELLDKAVSEINDLSGSFTEEQQKDFENRALLLEPIMETAGELCEKHDIDLESHLIGHMGFDMETHKPTITPKGLDKLKKLFNNYDRRDMATKLHKAAKDGVIEVHDEDHESFELSRKLAEAKEEVQAEKDQAEPKKAQAKPKKAKKRKAAKEKTPQESIDDAVDEKTEEKETA